MSKLSVREWQASVEEWEDVMQRLQDLPSDYKRQGLRAIMNISADLIDGIIAQGSAIRDQIVPVVPVFVDAVTNLVREGETQQLSFARLCVIDCIGVASATGAPIPSEVFASTRTALSMIETVGGDVVPLYHWHHGLAALAFDAPEVYRSIAGLGLHQKVTFVADQRFGSNIQGFIAHLVGAVESGAPIAECMTAWNDQLEHYPHTRAQKVFYAPSLLWAAWTLHHRIAAQPRETVADWLHASVYRAAGVEP
jgi:hypothetical protein